MGYKPTLSIERQIELDKYGPVLTPREYAEFMKIGLSTVLKHCKEGTIDGASKECGLWRISADKIRERFNLA